MLVKPVALYAHSNVLSGKPVKIMGLPDGKHVANVDPDIVAQFTQCLENLKASLQQNSLVFENLIDVQVRLKNKQDFSAFNKAWNEVFGNAAKLPTRTTRSVENLSNDAYKIELECTAEKPVENSDSLTETFVYLCGLGPRDKKTNTVPGIVRNENREAVGYDIVREFNQCVTNVEDVLLDHNLSLKNVTEMRLFVVNDQDLAKLTELSNKTFEPFGNKPKLIVEHVTWLPVGGDADIHTELTCIAAIP